MATILNVIGMDAMVRTGPEAMHALGPFYMHTYTEMVRNFAEIKRSRSTHESIVRSITSLMHTDNILDKEIRFENVNNQEIWRLYAYRSAQENIYDTPQAM